MLAGVCLTGEVVDFCSLETPNLSPTLKAFKKHVKKDMSEFLLLDVFSNL